MAAIDPCELTGYHLGLPYGLFSQRFYQSLHVPVCLPKNVDKCTTIYTSPIQFIMDFAAERFNFRQNEDYSTITRNKMDKALNSWLDDELETFQHWLHDQRTVVQHWWNKTSDSTIEWIVTVTTKTKNYVWECILEVLQFIQKCIMSILQPFQGWTDNKLESIVKTWVPFVDESKWYKSYYVDTTSIRKEVDEFKNKSSKPAAWMNGIWQTLLEVVVLWRILPGKDNLLGEMVVSALVQRILDINNAGQMGVHHRVLGIDRLATEDEINRAYRRLALKLHTDKNAAPGAPEAFLVLNSAEETCLSFLWEENEVRQRVVDHETEGPPHWRVHEQILIPILAGMVAYFVLSLFDGPK